MSEQNETNRAGASLRAGTRPSILAVNECFLTVQGEGVHLGRCAYFIRLQGCPVKCPWCDSAGTWNPNWFPSHILKISAEALADKVEAEAPAGAIVVITGGEPTQYNLEPLASELRQRGYRVHLETAGINPPQSGFHWITLSPKLPYAVPLPETIAIADEIKIIVESEESFHLNFNAVLPHLRSGTQVWLHPEWSQRANPDILRFIVEACKADTGLRAGYQMHKIYRADAFDPGSQKMIIPLGGNPDRGNSQ